MNQSQDRLKEIAYQIRKDVLISLHKAGSGHLGASLGLSDIFTVLYFDFLRHNPKQPDWPERDRLIVSIGHVAPVLYASLAHAGYFDRQELVTLRKLGSMLQGHPATAHNVPGLETTAGSLGQGLSIAVGMTLADKMDNKNRRVVSIHGDGELQEGSIWEAAMSAGHYKLNNLIAIVDRNKVQIDGKTEKVMRLKPLKSKWESFNWHVLECNGNNITDIINTLEKANEISNKPVVILANTKMGAGVKSIENDHTWHGKPPQNQEQLNQFLNELEEAFTSQNG
ncbi:MAG: transketolase [Bacteroidota bacterium]|nr:transketolase [Bacteroidota bacterium]